MLCCVVVAAGVVPDSDADVASLREMLAAALEANGRWERAAAELRADNGRLHLPSWPARQGSSGACGECARS